MVQFILGSNFLFFCFKLIIMLLSYIIIPKNKRKENLTKDKVEPQHIHACRQDVALRAENMKPSVKLKILEEIVKGYHECFFMASADQKLIVKKKRGHKDPALTITDTGPAAASLDFATSTHAYCIGH